MTAEQPWPEELREIVAKAIREQSGFTTDWDAVNQWDRERWIRQANPVLSALAASPYAVVDTRTSVVISRQRWEAIGRLANAETGEEIDSLREAWRSVREGEE